MRLVAAALLLCAAATVLADVPPPFGSPPLLAALDPEEARVWGNGREFDRAIEKSGQLLPDPVLTAYVQGVFDRLYPEFAGTVRVRIIAQPQLNAFALPHGSIYINQGMLARFDNEAQLATVLAHEGTHFTHRHGYRSQQSTKSLAAFATIIAMAGVPLIGDIIAISSMFGYSRELETEADEEGFRRLAAAGYDVRESPEVFEQLMNEVKALDIKEPFFFSTHPKLQDRVDNFRKLSASAPAEGSIGADDYAARVAGLRLANLAEEISSGRAKAVILVLTDPERRKDYPPEADYWLGEAYRQRKDKGDDELAEQAYRSAIAAAPTFAPPYRALGILYLRQKRLEDAATNLIRYIQLAPEAPDRAYVQQYLDIAGKREP